MKAFELDDNWRMGRFKDFYDALVFRRSSLDAEPVQSVQHLSPKLEAKLVDLLNLTDANYVVVDAHDEVISACDALSPSALIKNNRITSDVILKLIRSARKSHEVIETQIPMPRSSITGGFEDRRARISAIGKSGHVAVLIFDDSEAKRLDAVRRDFVANISHELKTPIGGISILAEAISEGNDDPELVKNFSERMKIEANRLSHLVQEIIDLSRIQDQNTVSNSENISLNKVIEEAIYQLKVRAEKRQVQIYFASDEEVMFFGDRKQLVMAFSNLLENAINYSPERTSVNVVLRKTNGVAEIAISDQGVGIAEADLERIFERFYRVDPARSRETGGTGLGLSIVKHVVSNHGGDVQVWSSPGTGSTFTIQLPLPAETEESK